MLLSAGVYGVVTHRSTALCARRLRSKRMWCTTVPAASAAHENSLSGSAYAGEVEAALLAVRRAARLCSGVQSTLKQAEETAQKADDSPVTVADFAAQALVSWSLKQAYPQHSLIAEEDACLLRTSAYSEMAARVTALVNAALAADGLAPLSVEAVLDCIDRGNTGHVTEEGMHFVLDPIDGTKGFVRSKQYAVALGLLDAGKVVMGVMGCPNLPLSGLPPDDALSVARGPSGGSLLLAAKGCGAYQLPMKGNGMDGASRVTVDSVRQPAAGRYMESERHSIAAAYGQTAKVAELMGIQQEPIRMDSQAKYGLLARGDADLYLRFPPADYEEKIWDHAAGSIIVEEAGAVVSDAAGAPLDFSQGRVLNMAGGIIASPMQMHAALVKACKAAGVV